MILPVFFIMHNVRNNPNNDQMPNSRRFTQLPTSFKIQKLLPIEIIPYNP